MVFFLVFGFSSFVLFTCTWFPQYFTVEFFSVFVCKWHLFICCYWINWYCYCFYHLCRCHRNCVVKLISFHHICSAQTENTANKTRFVFSTAEIEFSWFCIGNVACCLWISESKCVRSNGVKRTRFVHIFYASLLIWKKKTQFKSDWKKKNVHNIGIDIVHLCAFKLPAHTHTSNCDLNHHLFFIAFAKLRKISIEIGQ